MSSENYEVLPQRDPEQKKRRRKSLADSSQVASEIPQKNSAGVLSEDDAVDVTKDEASRAEIVDTTAAWHVPQYRSQRVGDYNFEYLDHTADVQLHAWGTTLAAAFEQVALAMMNYMTPLDEKKIDETLTRDVEVGGEQCHDLHSLLFAFLDELLFLFESENLVCCDINIKELDQKQWSIKATVRGETFDRQQHVSGTAVKAITYSAMQVIDKDNDAEVFVIVDI